MILLLLAALTFLSSSVARGREPDLLQEAPSTIGARLMQDAAIKSAVERVRRDEPQVLEEQARICEIPAPPFKEAKRAEAFRQAFGSLGLKNVRVDSVGNVIGERPGEFRNDADLHWRLLRVRDRPPGG